MYHARRVPHGRPNKVFMHCPHGSPKLKHLHIISSKPTVICIGILVASNVRISFELLIRTQFVTTVQLISRSLIDIIVPATSSILVAITITARRSSWRIPTSQWPEPASAMHLFQCYRERSWGLEKKCQLLRHVLPFIRQPDPESDQRYEWHHVIWLRTIPEIQIAMGRYESSGEPTSSRHCPLEGPAQQLVPIRISLERGARSPGSECCINPCSVSLI